MDHRFPDGQDISNFSSPSPPAPVLDRMPTVSAAQALQDLQSIAARSISTGLDGLDGVLVNGGVPKGQVTEVYGPPGVGKTALGIQLAANALRTGQGLLWVDAGHPLPGRRLIEVLSSATKKGLGQDGLPPSAESPTVDNFIKNLNHFVTPTLPHFIALLCNTSPSFPSQTTGMIIIDSLSALIASAYPKAADNSSTPRKAGATSKYDPQSWAASRKWAVLQSLISSLGKLATFRNIAIVILNQSVTKMRSGSKAMLIPSITSTAWDAGLSTRIVLFRDWGWDGKQVRFARVVKSNGVLAGSNVTTAKSVAFTIESHGLADLPIPEMGQNPGIDIIATPSRKRKVDEIRDSDDEDELEGSDEDYGWGTEDDGELPQPPPQLQGSEDILVPFQEEMDGDEQEEGVEGVEEVEDYGSFLLPPGVKVEEASGSRV